MKSIIETVCEFILGAAIIMIISFMFDSVYVADFTTAFLVSVVLSLLNKFVKPILNILAFPINVMSLGLFKFIINAFILSLVTMVVDGFYIHGFFMTIVVSICISVMYSIVGLSND